MHGFYSLQKPTEITMVVVKISVGRDYYVIPKATRFDKNNVNLNTPLFINDSYLIF